MKKKVLKILSWALPGAVALFLAVVLLIPVGECMLGNGAQRKQQHEQAVAYYQMAADYARAPLPAFFYRLAQQVGLGSYSAHADAKLIAGQEALVQYRIALGYAALEAGDATEGAEILLALPVGEQTCGQTVSGQDRARFEQDVDFTRACNLEAAGEYTAAAALFDTLTLREEAPAAALRCRALQQREDGLALQAQQKYDSALASFAAAAALEEAVPGLADLEELMQACAAQREAYLAERFPASGYRLGAGAWNSALTLADGPLVVGDAVMDQPQPQGSSPMQFFGGYAGIYGLQLGKVQVLRGGNGFADELEALSRVQKVAGGIGHVLALQQDGTVHAFGSDAFHQCSGALAAQAGAPAQGDADAAAPETRPAVDIAAGALHSVVLLQDGTVVISGDNTYGQCDATGTTGITQVAAGLHHTVLLHEDGTVSACGDNAQGQCDVGKWKNIRAVYCGGNFTLGLQEDFTLVAAGDNTYGQCAVEDFTSVVSVACGLWHTLALDMEGNLLLCGSNANGQLTMPEAAPVRHSSENLAYTENIYGTQTQDGPWLYVGGESIVSVYKNHEGELRGLIRSDLYTTYGKQPFGAFADLNTEGRSYARPMRIARQNRVVYAQTADFITYRDNKKGVMIRNGRVYYDMDDAPTMAFLPNGEMVIYEPGAITADELLAMGVTDSFAFGPILALNGQVHPSTYGHPLRPSNYRTSFGMAERGHFISLTSGLGCGRTLAQLGENYLYMGCDRAYNLDGGNSTSVVFMGEQINLHRYNAQLGLGVRNLPDVLALTVTESVPTVDDPQKRAEQYDYAG